MLYVYLAIDTCGYIIHVCTIHLGFKGPPVGVYSSALIDRFQARLHGFLPHHVLISSPISTPVGHSSKLD